MAAALTLAILAWGAGTRGVVGSVQDAAAAVLAIVATTTALDSFGSLNTGSAGRGHALPGISGPTGATVSCKA